MRHLHRRLVSRLLQRCAANSDRRENTRSSTDCERPGSSRCGNQTTDTSAKLGNQTRHFGDGMILGAHYVTCCCATGLIRKHPPHLADVSVNDARGIPLVRLLLSLISPTSPFFPAEEQCSVFLGTGHSVLIAFPHVSGNPCSTQHFPRAKIFKAESERAMSEVCLKAALNISLYLFFAFLIWGFNLPRLSGAVLPEGPRQQVDIRYPTQIGRIINVPTGGDLQQALDEAQGTDTIVLQPGSVYRGNFVLRRKQTVGTIVIRTATPDSQLPAVGDRISPSAKALLPRIETPNAAPVFSTESGAKLIGLWD